MPLKHMKSLIVLVVGLLTVGCATLTPEQKQKTLRDSVVGEYEYKPTQGQYSGRVTSKLVFLENGIRENYFHGQKQAEKKWSIENKEMHVKFDFELIHVYRINKNKSITLVAAIRSGKREARSKQYYMTFKKIK